MLIRAYIEMRGRVKALREGYGAPLMVQTMTFSLSSLITAYAAVSE
ncbi:MAG: hypothetical protein QXZ17_00330 [Nitrososphaerota archaeon]